MQKLSNKFGFLFAVLISLAVIIACSKKDDDTSDKKEETTKEKTTTDSDTKKEETTTSDNTSSGGSLYFCEDYRGGKEIGVSDRFTPGWLTVMVRTDEPLGVGKVELRLTKVADAAGNSVSEKIIDTIPFDVQADWDYTYFQDKDRLRFTTPGTYKVTLQKVDGSPIVSGEVTVVRR